MTSSVKVAAHCGNEKQVEVKLSGETQRTLNDGESVELYIYDDREVSAREIPKAE